MRQSDNQAGVQEDGAGGRQPQQKQQQLQFKAHVQEEGAGEEPQHAAMHGVLRARQGQSGGGACPAGRAGDTPGLPSHQGGRGDSHTNSYRVGLVSAPVRRMEWGRDSQGLWGTLNGHADESGGTQGSPRRGWNPWRIHWEPGKGRLMLLVRRPWWETRN